MITHRKELSFAIQAQRIVDDGWLAVRFSLHKVVAAIAVEILLPLKVKVQDLEARPEQ